MKSCKMFKTTDGWMAIDNQTKQTLASGHATSFDCCNAVRKIGIFVIDLDTGSDPEFVAAMKKHGTNGEW